MFCTSTRSCARADDAKIVRSRDAQCNTEELPEIAVDNLKCAIIFTNGLTRKAAICTEQTEQEHTVMPSINEFY